MLDVHAPREWGAQKGESDESQGKSQRQSARRSGRGALAPVAPLIGPDLEAVPLTVDGEPRLDDRRVDDDARRTAVAHQHTEPAAILQMTTTAGDLAEGAAAVDQAVAHGAVQGVFGATGVDATTDDVGRAASSVLRLEVDAGLRGEGVHVLVAGAVAHDLRVGGAEQEGAERGVTEAVHETHAGVVLLAQMATGHRAGGLEGERVLVALLAADQAHGLANGEIGCHEHRGGQQQGECGGQHDHAPYCLANQDLLGSQGEPGFRQYTCMHSLSPSSSHGTFTTSISFYVKYICKKTQRALCKTPYIQSTPQKCICLENCGYLHWALPLESPFHF